MQRPWFVIGMLLLVAQLSTAEDLYVEPTQSTNAHYRLYNTRNIYTFLKLDTTNGLIWQIQWGDKDHRYIEMLNSRQLVAGGKIGRFTLHPTQNIYTFLLLDQETGETWQVQWGDSDHRFITPFNQN